MSAGGCDRGWEADARREGRLGPLDVESFERHCRVCAACAGTVERDERLRGLGRALPVAEPGQLALRRLRARVLRDVTTGVPRSSVSWERVAFASSLGMVVVAIAALIAVRTDSRSQASPRQEAPAAPSPGTLAGSVAPAAGAVWRQTREEGVERVELEAGTLRVHVRAQSPGERFIVQLPDGEIEVRGTTFDVTALDGSTRHVGVDEGTVVLRLRGSPDLRLGPRTSWEGPASPRESATGDVTAVATSAPATSPKRRSPQPRDARLEDDGAAAYVGAMRSFREGHYDLAAAAFHAFALAHPRAPEGEDASFLEAVSLARAGRADAAALAAERHLESFPRSFRRKEASILMARAAGRRGNCDEARRVLAAWMHAAPDAEIQSALQACGDSGSDRP